MKAYDFEYDGILLSSLGFIICKFDSGDTETISNGSEITFNTVSTLHGAKYELINTGYDSCLETTLQICKNPCGASSMEITVDELRIISRWLNRKEYLKFKFLTDDYWEYYYEASFNISYITIGGTICGLELELTTNRPFALQEPQTVIIENEGDTEEHHIKDFSDVEGFIYPDVQITLSDQLVGNDNELSIYNALEDRITVISNCSAGETITMRYPIIETDNEDHKIQNDFNWVFFRLANKYRDSSNHVTISLPCVVRMTYSPPARVGI